MRTPVNLRLDNWTLTLLKELTVLQQTTRTAVIETAIKLYAQQQKIYIHPLERYIGSLSENEANDLLNVIQESHYDQTRDVIL